MRRKVFAAVIIATTAVGALSRCGAATSGNAAGTTRPVAVTAPAANTSADAATPLTPATPADAATPLTPATPAEAVTPKTPATPDAAAASGFTISQQNAIESAQSYLESSSFSRAGLIDQLTSKAGDGFAMADAVFAVDHITVDWNKEAVESAKSYLATGGFSKASLIDQLSSTAGDRFTTAQATYAVGQVGLGETAGRPDRAATTANANDNAAASGFTISQQNSIESAQSYLESSSFSRAGLIDQLTSKAGDGFPMADAVFAVDHITVDWNKEAVESAKSYLAMGGFSRASLIDQLSSSAGEQFTSAQATYAADHVGL